MNREVRRLLARGFAEQALADLTGYQQLCRIGGLPVCHRLHFLQMALEKLAKSFLWGAEGERDADLSFSHNVIAKLLPQVLKKEWGGRRGGISRTQMMRIRRLCREIDLLHPQVDAGQSRPDNCEYPWIEPSSTGPRLHVPASELFGVTAQLYSPAGQEFLKVVNLVCQKAVSR